MANDNKLEIPPATIADLLAALKDSTQSVYLVIGPKEANAWLMARSVQKDLAGIFTVRVENPADAATWITDNVSIGATFDSSGQVKSRLSKAQAEDRSIVARALGDALGS